MNRILKFLFVFILLLPTIAPNALVKSVQAESLNTRINLGFEPHDNVMDPVSPILYMTKLGSKTLYSVNFSTGEIKTLILPYPAERLDLFENKLYVTQHKMSHENSTNLPLMGAIAEVDTTTFTLNSLLDITEDPYDIAVDSNGFIYVSPGSNQWGNLRVYSISEKAEIAQDNLKTSISDRSDIRYNPSTSKIYSLDTNSSPEDITAFEVVNGVIQDSYDSPYHGDYDMEGMTGFSHDGLNLYDNSGNVFNLAPIKSGDMVFNFTYGKGYNDFAFSTEQNVTFGASKTRGIDVYEYGSNKYLYALRKDLHVQELHLQNGQLVSINKDDNGQYFIETMSSDTQPVSGLPETPGVPDPAGTIDNLGFTPMDTAIDPLNPVVYMTRPGSKTIYAANYSTGEIKSLALPYPAERLELYNGNLYVTQHEMNHEYSTEELLIGAIAEVDTETFEAVKLIEVDTDPYDIAIDDSGNIYIAPGSNQWEDMKVYSSVTGGEVVNSENDYMGAKSLIYHNQSLSKIYTIDTDSSPRDVSAFEVQDGIIKNYYDSPYHGDYELDPTATITPDGQSMYNTSGVVFNLAMYKSGDMTYRFDLGTRYKDYEFNIEEQLTYAARLDGGIDVFAYDTNEYLYSVAQGVKAEQLHFQNGLVALFTDSNGNVQLNQVNTDEQYVPGTGDSEDPGIPADPTPAEFLEAVSITYYDDGDEDYNYESFYDGVEDVPINSFFALLFDQEIVVNDPSGISIVGPDGTIEVDSSEYEDVLYIIPPLLAGNTKYTLHINSDAISGYDGSPLAEDLIIQFTTGPNWVYYGGYWYYYNPLIDDYAAGLNNIDGEWYLFNSDGAMQTGWQKINGHWYYFNEEGIMVTGWIKPGKTWYYLDAQGIMKTGWIKSGMKWYYLDPSGAMKTGWVKSGTKWYYLESSGAMKTGWIKSGTKWYYLESSGAMKTGWVKSGTKWYFLEASGAMKTGWVYTGGKWYYLYSSGAMAYNTTINGYKLGPDGAWRR